MQHHLPQNPNSLPVDPQSHHLYPSHFVSHQQSEIPNPNPNPNPNPPGIDPGACVSHVHETYPPVAAYAHHQAADASALALQSGYYQDPSVVNALQNWAAEVLQYYGSAPLAPGATIPPNVTEQLVHAHANSQLWTNPIPIVKPRRNLTWKKVPKKTKIVQSAFCEVCKITCNSEDVLEQHKLGKKHLKNMEKLKEAIAPPPVPNSLIGPQENPNKGNAATATAAAAAAAVAAAAAAVRKTKKKATAATVEDLETKRRKILEGGAAAGAVRMCTICNVVCNSAMVFAIHVAGKKHALMTKKHAGATSVATTT